MLLLLFYLSVLPADVPILLLVFIVLVFLFDTLLLKRVTVQLVDSKQADKFAQSTIQTRLKKTFGKGFFYVFIICPD